MRRLCVYRGGRRGVSGENAPVIMGSSRTAAVVLEQRVGLLVIKRQSSLENLLLSTSVVSAYATLTYRSCDSQGCRPAAW